MSKQLPHMDDDEIDFIVDDINKELKKSDKKSKIKKLKVEKNMDKEKFKKTVQAHKDEIAKCKARRAGLKAEIKKHKLLIKQAKLVYKLSKMKG